MLQALDWTSVMRCRHQMLLHLRSFPEKHQYLQGLCPRTLDRAACPKSNRDHASLATRRHHLVSLRMQHPSQSEHALTRRVAETRTVRVLQEAFA